MKNYKAEVKALAKNNKTRCFDCNMPNPQWASTSYGIFVCLECAGIHRSYGLLISRIKSINMDNWSLLEYKLLEIGGNDKLEKFFADKNISKERGIYKQSALLGYAKQLKERVAEFETQQPVVEIKKTIIANEYKNYSSLNFPRTDSEKSIQETITNTLTSVGKNVVKGARVIKQKTILYGGKFNESFVKPSIKLIRDKSGFGSASIHKTEEKDILPNDNENEDFSKWQ